MTGLEQFTVRSRPIAWALYSMSRDLVGGKIVTYGLYHGVCAVEDHRSHQIRPLGAELFVRILADIQKQTGVDPGAAAGGGERENADLSQVQDFRVVAHELGGGRAGCSTVVDVVERSITGGGDDRAPCAIETRGCTQLRSEWSERGRRAGTHAILGRLELREMKLRVERSTSLFSASGVASAIAARQITEANEERMTTVAEVGWFLVGVTFHSGGLGALIQLELISRM
jgi:hypothetical protein